MRNFKPILIGAAIAIAAILLFVFSSQGIQNQAISLVELVVFWFFWIILTGGAVCGFYYLDNKWLED